MRVLLCILSVVALCQINAERQYALQPDGTLGYMDSASMMQESQMMNNDMAAPPMEPPLIQSEQEVPSLAQLSSASANEPVSAENDGPAQEDEAPAPRLDPEDQKLSDALDQVKSDLLNKGKTVQTEAVWIQNVEKIIGQYHKKISNVHKNIEGEKVKMTAMLQKKRQIQNLMIQRSLEKQLESASSSLGELKSQMKAIQKKNDEATENKKTIEDNIKKIEESLKSLRGEEDKKEEGEADAGNMKDDQDLAKLAKDEKARLDALIEESTSH